MKVVIKLWSGNVVTDLAVALQPESGHEGGVAESALAQADLNAEVLGRLAALMVEKGVISIKEAAHACAVYQEIETYVEPAPSPWAKKAPKGDV